MKFSEILTFHQGNFPIEAIATEIAGLRCPPETPPETRMPRRTPRPQLGRKENVCLSLSVGFLPPVYCEEVSFCLKR